MISFPNTQPISSERPRRHSSIIHTRLKNHKQRHKPLTTIIDNGNTNNFLENHRRSSEIEQKKYRKRRQSLSALSSMKQNEQQLRSSQSRVKKKEKKKKNAVSSFLGLLFDNKNTENTNNNNNEPEQEEIKENIVFCSGAGDILVSRKPRNLMSNQTAEVQAHLKRKKKMHELRQKLNHMKDTSISWAHTHTHAHKQAHRTVVEPLSIANDLEVDGGNTVDSENNPSLGLSLDFDSDANVLHFGEEPDDHPRHRRSSTIRSTIRSHLDLNTNQNNNYRIESTDHRLSSLQRQRSARLQRSRRRRQQSIVDSLHTNQSVDRRNARRHPSINVAKLNYHLRMQRLRHHSNNNNSSSGHRYSVNPYRRRSDTHYARVGSESRTRNDLYGSSYDHSLMHVRRQMERNERIGQLVQRRQNLIESLGRYSNIAADADFESLEHLREGRVRRHRRPRLMRQASAALVGGRVSIQSLPVRKIRECDLVHNEKYSSCSICQEKFMVDDAVKTLPCFHFFHAKEIDRWLNSSRDCPICRHSIDKCE